MKKRLGMLLAAAVTAGALAGCSTKPADTAKETTTAAETTKAAEETTAGEGTAAGIKTGLAVVSSLEKSKDAKDKDGTAQVDSVAAAVILDEDGRILNCVLDTAQSMMAFTSEGKVADALDKEFQTKKELKEDYGMNAVSSIGKEWYEQAQALEEYVIGKTIEEVQGIAVDESTVPTDEDLASSVTVKIGDYVEAIAQAADNAHVIGTGKGDKLGLGIVTTMEKSKDAKDGKDGQCQADSIYTVVTTAEDGTITSTIIDATQGIVTFDANGKITSDLTAGVRTKRQLGDEYGMKNASQLGKEWYEQAASMEAFVTGKTLEEVKGIAVREDGKTEDEDLASSVTIAVGGFQSAIEKAVNNAR